MAGTILQEGTTYWAENDKDSRLDYSFDWAGWVSAGDSITSSEWTADAGITIDTPTLLGTVSSIWVSGGEPNQWYALTNTVTSAMGRRDQRVLQVFVPADVSATPPVGSALFPNRFAATAELRRDRLMLSAAAVLPSVKLSDEFLWQKLQAAEAEAQRELKVYFQPTNILPDDAPQSEIDAAEASGEPWAQEAAYDYDSSFFRGEKWGYLLTKSRPIISVNSIRFVYPSALNQMFEIPHDWLRLDRKYGQIRLVPTSTGFAAPLAAYTLQVMGGGLTIPFMIQVRYKAGLVNAPQNWPDLLDVVKKKAVLSILTDAYLPQSGSISADGLSQSMSVDMSKYYDIIDLKMNGPKGANGGLMTAIHGIRMGVLGAV